MIMKIGIVGCAGRMGRNLLKAVFETDGCEISGGLEHSASDFLGVDLGILMGQEKLGVEVTSDLEGLLKESDAIIDFTRPEASLAFAEAAAKHNVAHIIGTTGMTDAQKEELASYGSGNVIVHAHNFSVGVNLLCYLAEKTASILPQESYDIEVVEMHHKHKVDAPSGTALSLGEAAAQGRGVALDDVACKSRDGITGERPVGEIGFATLRGGDVIGDHTVMYASPFERIELTHKAQDRSVFAVGAVRAALWTQGKNAGLYSMQDVLGLNL